MPATKRDRENINPTPEAVAAMSLWPKEYAFGQRGGSMDFWHSLSDSQKRTCKDLVERIRDADKAHSRR